MFSEQSKCSVKKKKKNIGYTDVKNIPFYNFANIMRM